MQRTCGPEILKRPAQSMAMRACMNFSIVSFFLVFFFFFNLQEDQEKHDNNENEAPKQPIEKADHVSQDNCF